MRQKYGLAARALGLAALLTLAGCGEREAATHEEGSQMQQIRGQVLYRERMMLPPAAEVEVEFQDISRADALAETLATVILPTDGAPPYEFAIDYDPAQIDNRRRYALRAQISVNGRLLFSSDEYIDPFAEGPVEIVVRRVPAPVAARAPALEGTRWTLQTLGGVEAGPGAGDKPLDLRLDAETRRASGFSGCNRFSGGYLRGAEGEGANSLTFKPLAGTLMACAQGGELEQLYLARLQSVDAFEVQGSTLSLLSGDEVVATFTAADPVTGG